MLTQLVCCAGPRASSPSCFRPSLTTFPYYFPFPSSLTTLPYHPPLPPSLTTVPYHLPLPPSLTTRRLHHQVTSRKFPPHEVVVRQIPHPRCPRARCCGACGAAARHGECECGSEGAELMMCTEWFWQGLRGRGRHTLIIQALVCDAAGGGAGHWNVAGRDQCRTQVRP